MNDYHKVKEALKAGSDPAMLCMTCPWDRFCIQPPSMTSDEIEQQIQKAKRDDDQQAKEREAKGEKGGLPVGSLMTVLAVGGRDTMASICPVLALRLRSSAGRDVVDLLKTHMQREEAS